MCGVLPAPEMRYAEEDRRGEHISSTPIHKEACSRGSHDCRGDCIHERRRAPWMAVDQDRASVDPHTRAWILVRARGARVTFHGALFPRSHRRPTKGDSPLKRHSLSLSLSRRGPLCAAAFSLPSTLLLLLVPRRPSLIVFTEVDSCLIAPERALCSLLGCETISNPLLSWASFFLPCPRILSPPRRRILQVAYI